MGKERIIPLLKQLMNDCKIITLEEIMLYEGLKSACPDFEDAMQISCAESVDCNYIITRNKKDFGAYTDIPVYTPKEFLKKITTPSTSCT